MDGHQPVRLGIAANQIICETARLLVRHLMPGDVPALAAIWSDPQATRHMGGARDFQEVCDSLGDDLRVAAPAKFDLWPVIVKSTSRVVGHCGLLDKEIDGHAEVELVYVLAAGAWGRGYATHAAMAIFRHAVQALGLDRLVSLVDPDNLASRRIARKVGMKPEREIVRLHGKMLLYSIELKTQNPFRIDLNQGQAIALASAKVGTQYCALTNANANCY